jgi:hypothetical protein
MQVDVAAMGGAGGAMKEPSEPPRRPLSLSGKKTFFPKGASREETFS